MNTTTAAAPGDATRIEARNSLVLANLGLVHHYLSRSGFRHRHDAEDLEQAGVMGLMRAAESFDPSLGTAFSTYAFRGIHNHVIDYLKGQADLIRVPHDISGEDRRRLRSTLRAAGLPSRDPASGNGDALADPKAAPPAEAVADADQAEVNRATARRYLDRLHRHARSAVELYYLHGLTCEEVGRRLGFSGSRASALIRDSLARLQKSAARELTQAEAGRAAGCPSPSQGRQVGQDKASNVQ